MQLEVVGKNYSTKVIKMAIANTTLNDTQIKVTLSVNGHKGEILKTTIAELAQVTSTNAFAASQKGATASILGLGTAFKGLWETIKAHPIIAGLTATIIIGTIVSGIYNNIRKSWLKL